MQTMFSGIEQARAEISREMELIPRSHGSGPNWEKNKDIPVTLGECCRSASISPQGGQYLYNTVVRIQPATIVELGTCLGVSGFYMAAGLKHLKKGVLFTIESQARRVEVAKQYRDKLGLTAYMKCLKGFFEEMVPPVLAANKVSMAFVDGSHTYEKTMEYFEMLVSHENFSGRIIFDDCKRSGVREALEDIVRDQRVFRSWEAAQRLMVVEVRD